MTTPCMILIVIVFADLTTVSLEVVLASKYTFTQEYPCCLRYDKIYSLISRLFNFLHSFISSFS